MATINVTVVDRVTNLGISGGIIVLFDKTSSTQTTATTNASGVATFTNVAVGSYGVYNTWISPDATPPTVCGFPSGYTGTTYARRLDVSVTTTGQTTALNFNFDKPVPWSSINGGNPPNIAFSTDGTTGYGVNLATGSYSSIGPLSNNGMGYCLADNMIYGQNIVRSDASGSSVTMNLPYTYSLAGIIGDCDLNSYFYAPPSSGNNSSFTCIDVNPSRTTYLRPVNPYLNYQEITTSPYQVTYTGATNAPNDNDWSYVKSVDGIVAGSTVGTQMWILSITTPKAYNVPIVGTPYVFVGVNFADTKNMYTPTGTQITKFTMSTTVAYGSVLSSSALPLSGDGARAATAPVFYAQAIPRKSVSSKYGVTGDKLTYTVTLANTGNTTATNVSFQDTLPDGVSFVPDTVKLNGASQPAGTTPSFVNIGTLPLNTVYTITFDAIINTNTLPSVSNIANINTTAYDSATLETISNTFSSNSVTTTLVNASALSIKSVDKSFASAGDTLTYTITISNTNNTTLLNVILLDTTPSNTQFVGGSVRVNGVTIPSATLFPSGFNIGTIGVGAISTINFKVTINPNVSSNLISNSATSTYTYNIDSTTTPTRTGSGGVNTNIANTTIVSADLSGITKFVDKLFATCGETITYTISIPNTGNTAVTNVVISDTVPNGTVLVPSSILVNGLLSSATSPTSVPLGTINPGATTTVSFQVRVQC